MFLKCFGLFVTFMFFATASRPASQAWFKATKERRLINATNEIVISNVTSSQCLRECKRRLRTGTFACSYANYGLKNNTCELSEEAENVIFENGWDMWAIQPLRDCSEMYNNGVRQSGSYYIYLPELKTSVKVYCDMDTDGGGWTVFQRRIDGSVDFYLDWQHYKKGFGDVDGEFWLGNDNLHYITSSAVYELRVDMEDDADIKVYAKYSLFLVNDEADHYRLTINGYDTSSTAGDSMKATGESTDQMKFSTYDADHDTDSGRNCAEVFTGAWWYRGCHSANLNGRYLSGDHTTNADGVNWYTFRGHQHSLLLTEMKIRPSGFSVN